jgi:hypothetical protein
VNEQSFCQEPTWPITFIKIHSFVTNDRHLFAKSFNFILIALDCSQLWASLRYRTWSGVPILETFLLFFQYTTRLCSLFWSFLLQLAGRDSKLHAPRWWPFFAGKIVSYDISWRNACLKRKKPPKNGDKVSPSLFSPILDQTSDPASTIYTALIKSEST